MSKITPLEKQATLSLAGIFTLRMLGLFMIYPIFSVYAKQYTGSSLLLIGVALSIYGLTQACFQIPFGMLSDKFGRKPMITLGLAIFALGSAVCAFSHSIWGIIAGRALQGAGAIGSVIIASVADLTQDEHRTQAMAIIGLSIGLSFGIAMIAGPILHDWLSLAGIFGLTTILALGGIIIVFTAVPKVTQQVFHQDSEPNLAQLKRVLKNKELLRLDLSIFISHASLTATFFTLPLILQNFLHWDATHLWEIYLPAFLAAFILMVPCIIFAEKKRQMKNVLLGAIVVLCASQLLFYFFHYHIATIEVALTLFFTAFTLLEAILPSYVSKVAPVHMKGTAVGVYSSLQFLGMFVGGALAGLLATHLSLASIFLANAIGFVAWFACVFHLAPPPSLSTLLLSVKTLTAAEINAKLKTLSQYPEIKEAVFAEAEGVIYVKASQGFDLPR